MMVFPSWTRLIVDYKIVFLFIRPSDLWAVVLLQASIDILIVFSDTVSYCKREVFVITVK